MSEILILARVRIHEFDLPIIADYYFLVSEKLSKVEGFNGLSVWRDPRDTESFLVVYDYADQEAADRGFEAVTTMRNQTETPAADFRPADVLRIKVGGRSSKHLHQTPATGFLSMSIRIADPGYGPELVENIEQVFSELQLLAGYVSSVYGINEALEEEVIGLVTWQSREAFATSLPPGKGPKQLLVYNRFF